ncbi:MAG: 2Fe-2S iron-sulfur cluster-binding protein [Myxococcota bacterium]
MTLRTRPIQKPVEFLHDGELLTAEAGEPLAFSLIAEERLLLARSPKLHRPRGPYCLRAACDGCLVRVDGVPNVMACQRQVLGGETVETQNVVGSRNVDLLAATDFMFPHGIDHHRLFAGVRGVSGVVQRMARRIAGLGRLPDAPVEVEPSSARDVDVLVVGGGASGLELATKLGARAVVVDEARSFGGAARLLAPERAEALLAAARSSGAELLDETCALGVFGTKPFGVLVRAGHGVTWVRARALVLANGGHDASPPFGNGDLPGVFSARAGLELLQAGVSPGRRVAVVGRGDFAERAAKNLGQALCLRLESSDDVSAAHGALQVTQLATRSGKTRVDAVLFDAVEAPAFELAVQAGGATHFEPSLGYVLDRDDDGAVSEGVFAVGRLATRTDGARPNIARVAARILSALNE